MIPGGFKVENWVYQGEGRKCRDSTCYCQASQPSSHHGGAGMIQLRGVVHKTLRKAAEGLGNTTALDIGSQRAVPAPPGNLLGTYISEPSPRAAKSETLEGRTWESVSPRALQASPMYERLRAAGPGERWPDRLPSQVTWVSPRHTHPHSLAGSHSEPRFPDL